MLKIFLVTVTRTRMMNIQNDPISIMQDIELQFIVFGLTLSSAYIKHHSAEMTLSVFMIILYTLWVFILQQVACLILLHLSAAFDIIDHSIVLERLSYFFGVPSTAVSYLLNRSFYVSVKNNKLSVFQLLYGVLQGFGPWFSTLHSIHHSS